MSTRNFKAPVSKASSLTENGLRERGSAVHVKSAVGDEIRHTFDHIEVKAFADHITTLVKGDPDLHSALPITNENLFDEISKGVLLCKVINAIKPGAIDEKKIVVVPKNPFHSIENHVLALDAATKSLGVNLVNIGWNDLQEKKPHIILGLLWKILKYGLLSNLNLEHHPELEALLAEDENISVLSYLNAEANLLRWFNYHLKRAGYKETDSVAYIYLLHQIAPEIVNKTALEEHDLEKRAELLLQNAEKLGCRQWIEPKSIVEGQANLNLAFVATVFNKCSMIESMNERVKSQREEGIRKVLEEDRLKKLEAEELLKEQEDARITEIQRLEEEARIKSEEEAKQRERELALIAEQKRNEEQLLKDQEAELEMTEGKEDLLAQQASDIAVKAENDNNLQEQESLKELERRKWAEQRQSEWDEQQKLQAQYFQKEEELEKEKQARKEAARLKAEAKQQEQAERDAKLQNRPNMPIVLWYDTAPEQPTQEEIYLATQDLNVIYEADESSLIQLLQAKGNSVVAVVTDLYRKDTDNIHSSVAVGLNLSNIIREELKSNVPIIVYGERVRKDPKLQTLCKNNGMKPVMRGNSLFKLLNVAEPPLGILK